MINDRKVIFLSILLFHTFFVYIGDLGSVVGRVIQAVCLFFFILNFNIRIKLWFKPSSNKKLFRLLLFYIAAIIVTSLLSRSIDLSYLRSFRIISVKDEYTPASYSMGIMTSIVVFMYFTFIEYLNTINKTYLMANVFYKLCLFYCIISDLASFAVGIDNLQIIGGGKFALSYLHIFLVAFYYLRNSTSNRTVPIKKYYGYILFAVVISIYTECTTALMGCMIVAIVFMFRKFFHDKVFRPKVLLVLLAICALFPILVTYIIDNPYVSYFIVEVLGEDHTLTGRLGIYETLGEVMLLRPIWGFGVGNGHYIMAFLYGTANAQNGVANLILEQGVLGLISVIALWITCMNEVTHKNNMDTVFGVYAIILALIIMSMAEITVDTRFVVFTSLLLLSSARSKVYTKKQMLA